MKSLEELLFGRMKSPTLKNLLGVSVRALVGAGIAASIFANIPETFLKYKERASVRPKITSQSPYDTTSSVPIPIFDYSKLAVPDVGYQLLLPEENYQNVELAPKFSLDGRLERSLRWESITDVVERKYGIPHGILLAMIMQESGGDPLQSNMQRDGGLGLMHIQPRTAHHYGLKVYQDSRVLSDKVYGQDLQRFLEENNFDMKRTNTIDERIHPVMNIDAGAKIVMDGYNAYHDWSKAVQYYFAPAYVEKNLGEEYWSRVNTWWNALKNPELRADAENDFNVRNEMNGVTFDKYLANFANICYNYGLEKYRKAPLVIAKQSPRK